MWLWPRQEECLLAMLDPKRRVAVRSGHKCGKSTVAACIALWFVACFPKARVILTAPTHRQVSEVLWREVKRLHREAKIKIGGRIAKSAAAGLRWPDGREMIGFSTDKPENMAGYSGEHVLFVVDEASAFSEAIFEVIEGNAQSGAKIFIISNPTQTAGFFYDAFHRFANLWKRVQISSEEASQYADRIPGLSRPDELAKQIGKWGRQHPIVRVRVLGEFPSAASDTIIPLHLVEKAHEKYRSIVYDAMRVAALDPDSSRRFSLRELGAIVGIEHGPLEIGVDVARFGDDDSVIQPRRGKFMFPQVIVHGYDSIQLAAAVLRVVRDLRTPHEKAHVKVDGIGYGAGVVDQLRAAKIVCVEGEGEARREEFFEPKSMVSVVDVNVAEKADDEEAYPNLRSQLWFAVADWLSEGGSLPPGQGDEEGMLDAELMTPTYKLDPKGRQVVEPKADTKKRMNRSPDRADAVSLSLYRSQRHRTRDPKKKTVAGGDSRWGAERGFG